MNLIVLTGPSFAPPPMTSSLPSADGAPDRGEDPEALIVDIAKRLDKGRFPPYQVRPPSLPASQLAKPYPLESSESSSSRLVSTRRRQITFARSTTTSRPSMGFATCATRPCSLRTFVPPLVLARPPADAFLCDTQGVVSSDYILKALLGGMNRSIDKQN